MSTETQSAISPDTFIKERRRGFKQGVADLLSRSGVKDDAELLALVEAGRKSRTQPPAAAEETPPKPPAKKEQPAASAAPEQKPGESDAKFEARLAKFEEQQKLILDRFAKEDKEREEAKAKAEAQAQEEAETKKAEAAYQEEVEEFFEVAGEVDALLDNPRKKAQLLSLWEADLKAMPKREFERKFGDKVPPDKARENVKAGILEIQKEYPSLFKPKAAEQQAPKAPGTTGAPAAPPAGNAANQGSPRPPLDVQKLSKKQYEQYSKNPKLFKEQYTQGLIEYPSSRK
jgi:hypothetical protein